LSNTNAIPVVDIIEVAYARLNFECVHFTMTIRRTINCTLRTDAYRWVAKWCIAKAILRNVTGLFDLRLPRVTGGNGNVCTCIALREAGACVAEKRHGLACIGVIAKAHAGIFEA
jgi:hypothetical protein